ncbi:MAG: spore coat associated protein CotJA [Ruminococcus sp.]|nr:spore coat associated protein CotJA [Ruminococcus sp.]
MPYAMAYVPFQRWQKTYDDEAGLERGTVFPCLDKPFIGEEAVKHDK